MGVGKRKVFDNVELVEMMADCGNFMPDEAGVDSATVDDLDENTIKYFLYNKFGNVLLKKGLSGYKFK